MPKILSYIINGNGIGLRILFPFALVVSILYTVALKSVAEENYIPTIQNVAEEFLPIRVENGIIVEPENTQKNYNVPNYNFPIVLDTTISDFDIAQLQSGIYISNNKIYIVNEGFNKIYTLKGSYYIPNTDYREAMKLTLNNMMLPAVLYGFVVLAFFFFLAILFYCGISYLVSHILKKDLMFKQRMRLNTLCYITTYVTLLLLEAIIGYSSPLVFLVATVSLQFLFFKDMPTIQN